MFVGRWCGEPEAYPVDELEHIMNAIHSSCLESNSYRDYPSSLLEFPASCSSIAKGLSGAGAMVGGKPESLRVGSSADKGFRFWPSGGS